MTLLVFFRHAVMRERLDKEETDHSTENGMATSEPERTCVTFGRIRATKVCRQPSTATAPMTVPAVCLDMEGKKIETAGDVSLGTNIRAPVAAMLSHSPSGPGGHWESPTTANGEPPVWDSQTSKSSSCNFPNSISATVTRKIWLELGRLLLIDRERGAKLREGGRQERSGLDEHIQDEDRGLGFGGAANYELLVPHAKKPKTMSQNPGKPVSTRKPKPSDAPSSVPRRPRSDKKIRELGAAGTKAVAAPVSSEKVVIRSPGGRHLVPEVVIPPPPHLLAKLPIYSACHAIQTEDVHILEPRARQQTLSNSDNTESDLMHDSDLSDSYSDAERPDKSVLLAFKTSVY
ncbi:hypothetical protein BU15DRAFT_63037 [Melanogaster broomeanus]|nr:hypothetical protein BU15DRAFT_63037 [Melanogaster broomeanus]